MRSVVSRREALSLANFDCYSQKRQETASWINASRGEGCIKSMSEPRIPLFIIPCGSTLIACKHSRRVEGGNGILQFLVVRH